MTSRIVPLSPARGREAGGASTDKGGRLKDVEESRVGSHREGLRDGGGERLFWLEQGQLLSAKSACNAGSRLQTPSSTSP